MPTSQSLLDAFRACGVAEDVVYVSLPITSGIREVNFLTKLGLRSVLGCSASERERWRRDVKQANETEAEQISAVVRTRYPSRSVVNPAALSVTTWDQSDYLGFWFDFIERSVGTLVATPGWPWSRGARSEVALAIRLGLPVMSLDGEQLTGQAAKGIADAAATELVERGWTQNEADRYLPPFPLAAPTNPSAVSTTFDWLTSERAYQLEKFGIDLDDKHTQEGIGQESWWWQQQTNYLFRASVLGLETPVGRQAAAKFVATACGMLESVIRVHGDLPRPGVSSGEIQFHQGQGG